MGVLDRCSQYCRDYPDCRPVIDAMHDYERAFGEPSPMERALDMNASLSVPCCLRAHPPRGEREAEASACA